MEKVITVLRVLRGVYYLFSFEGKREAPLCRSVGTPNVASQVEVSGHHLQIYHVGRK